MAQLRLSQKFAKDCKVAQLELPDENTKALDDWFFDAFLVHRKKITLVTHAKTLFSAIIPYADAGGAKHVFELAPKYIETLLGQYGLSQYNEMLWSAFESPHRFCKTQDKRVLGHMNDFKSCIQTVQYSQPPGFIDWPKLMDDTNNIPVNIRSTGYTSPIELMKSLLAKQTINSASPPI